MRFLDPAQWLPTLPPTYQENLQQVRQVAMTLNMPTYLVGGFVRDVLLGLAPDDFDVVVEGEQGGPRLARALAAHVGGTVRVHPPFATATWFAASGAAIDCVTARTETYPHPAALPVVATPAPLGSDLARRDFTLNTLALRLDGAHFGQVTDPFAGEADLRAGVVRVLHAQSFVDDPTRLFRAVRYAGRFGFALAPETAALIPAALAHLPALSGDRLRHELERMFDETQTSAMLAQLERLGILAASHPALRWDTWAAEQAAGLGQWPHAAWRLQQPLAFAAVWFGLMLNAASDTETQAALQRLKVNRPLSAAIRAGLQLSLPELRPSVVTQVCDEVSEAAVVVAYALRPAWRAVLHSYLAQWRWTHPHTTGNDLIQRGLTPGPRFKTILSTLRAALLDGHLPPNDLAAEQSFLTQLLSQ